MDSDDEYRRQAADAMRQADRAKNEVDRAAWLRLAHGWMSLVRGRLPTAMEVFDAETAAKRTDQSVSDTSH